MPTDRGADGPERRIVVISAGLAQPSSTRLLADRLAQATVAELTTLGAPTRVRTVELRDLAHAVVDAQLTGFASGELRTVLDDLGAADGLIAVTPVFRASYSGLFKSFWDVVDRATVEGVPTLLGATGGTARHSLALDFAVRPLFAYLRTAVVPTSVFAATDDWADAGSDDARPLPHRIAAAAAELAAAVAARPRVTRVGLYDDVPSFQDLLGGV